MYTMKISLYELLKCLSNAQDLVSPLLSKHHQQVAYLSYCLARELELPAEDQKDIFLAALVHDIGALSMNERLDIIEKEPFSINNHAFIGAKLLDGFKPLQNSVSMIKFHHLSWDHGNGMMYEGEAVPFGSHILHISDRVCGMIRHDRNILSQLPQIMNVINAKSNSVYEPELVEMMNKLSRREYIWFDLMSDVPVDRINISMFDIIDLEIDDIIDLASIFSQIIDFRSSFTARHSAGVAKTSECLAKSLGFSPVECKMMLIAGYLHDLGKLAIDNSILEKPMKLDVDEFNEIRSHTYYTYQLLHTIPQFKIINEWASYHHERLDGKGYPFHIKGSGLSLGARVMAVADVFTAIMENRPYRIGMNDIQAKAVLQDMVSAGALDGKVVQLLLEDFRTINVLREKSQNEASLRYENFLHF